MATQPRIYTVRGKKVVLDRDLRKISIYNLDMIISVGITPLIP